MHEKALLFIVLFPLIGAIVNGIFGRKAGRSTVHAIAVLSVAASFGFALYAFVHLYQMRMLHDEEAAIRYTAWEWFSVVIYDRTVPVHVRFVMDSLSGVMTLIVTGIGLLIHIYSTGYMSEEKSYARFFAYLNLFMASMLVLVLGSSFPVLFVGWEGVGLCSYLLIGFWFENENYAKAGRKAFVVNRIGDFGVLVGMFILAAVVHSFEFERINDFAREHAGVLTSALKLGPPGQPYLALTGVSVATVATLFLFLGCTGKSAQLPLYVWLPDAMAGPTPVSALIHAATMVTSGLYLICRLSPLFALAPISMAVIAVTGARTALLAASVGLVQNEIKKILAYSTVSQLGFMFAAVGCGAFAAGFMHVYTHAFFKACLFLGAGSVMHAVGAHGDADIRTLGGLRKYMPHTRWTFLVSCLAIAGVPLFSGFFSKDEILVGALSVNGYFSFAPWLGKVVFAMLVVGATMTAFYMFRLYFLTFSGEFRGGPHHDDHGHADAHHDEHAHEPHESPLSMTIPLMVLGAGAIVAGYVWIGLIHFDPWLIWLEPALGSIGVEHPHSAPWLAFGFGTLAAAGGIGTAWIWYYKGSETPARLAQQFPRVHAFLMDRWRMDEFYDATILSASRLLARFLAAYDKWVVDGILTEVTSQTVKAASFLFTRMQNGLVHAYGTAMAVGLLGVTFYFIVPHVEPEVSAESTGYRASLTADKGLSYEFRWDFEGDGEFDTTWGPEPKVEHEFNPGDIKAYAVVFEAASLGRLGGAPDPETLRLQPGKSIKLSENQLGPTWQVTGGGALPRVVAEDDEVVVEVNGARVRKDGQLVKGSVRVKRGEFVNIGEARLTVTGLVHTQLAVRNAFGMERIRTIELAVPKVEPRGQARVAVRGASAP